MREIKFRYWDSFLKQMYYSDYWIWEEWQGAIQQTTPDRITMQFTGMLDKSGKEIYEGDILDRKGIPCEVYWHDHEWRLAPRGERQFDKTPPFLFVRSMEVIGNVWENCDLIKEA
jgi:hypothetical protein